MTAPTSLSLGGFVPMSTVDWPGQLAATVFTRGCPWDCPYCHNPHLLTAAASDVAPPSEAPQWADVLSFLTQRVGLLDGVVFSGGEPCAQAALPEAVEQVAEMGFGVGLHTGGAVPSIFESVLAQTSWVGFDVKAPFSDYARITRIHGSGERALASLRLLVASGTPFEARTTVHPDLLGAEDLDRMADELEDLGVRRWVLQGYREQGARPGLLPATTLDPGSIPAEFSTRFELSIR